MSDFFYVDYERWKDNGKPRTYKQVDGKWFYADWPNGITKWLDFELFERKNPNWHKNAEWKPE